MFLRWMVRQDDKGVDFGLWTRIPAGPAGVPLRRARGTMARRLGLITRKQMDCSLPSNSPKTLRHSNRLIPSSTTLPFSASGSKDRYALPV
jgi:hypothetical protein